MKKILVVAVAVAALGLVGCTDSQAECEETGGTYLQTGTQVVPITTMVVTGTTSIPITNYYPVAQYECFAKGEL